MVETGSEEKLRDAFRDIIEGRVVKRVKHEMMWEGRDVAGEFIEALERHGYHATTVEDVQIEPGERVPAFFVENGVAYFGWVFWEKFTQLRLRKLFGSLVRNQKGDWSIQIPPQRRTVIYANPALKGEMDIDNPSGF